MTLAFGSVLVALVLGIGTAWFTNTRKDAGKLVPHGFGYYAVFWSMWYWLVIITIVSTIMLSKMLGSAR